MRYIFKSIKIGMAGPRVKGAAISILMGTILFLTFFLKSAPKNLPLCTFHTVTGLPCPSCGMTRAFISLSHGEFRSAFFFNPASMLIYLAAWTGLILALLQVVFNKNYIGMIWNKSKRIIFPVTLIIMALTWAYKLTSHFNG